jgi:hypothetical protein
MKIIHIVGARPNLMKVAPVMHELSKRKHIVGDDLGRLQAEVGRILSRLAKRGQVPPLWDGHAGERIADIVVEFLLSVLLADRYPPFVAHRISKINTAASSPS